MWYPLLLFLRTDYIKMYSKIKKIIEYLQVKWMAYNGILYTLKLHIICKINSHIHSTSTSDARQHDYSIKFNH